MKKKDKITDTAPGYENDGFEKDLVTYKESKSLPEQQKQAKEQ